MRTFFKSFYDVEYSARNANEHSFRLTCTTLLQLPFTKAPYHSPTLCAEKTDTVGATCQTQPAIHKKTVRNAI